MDRTVKVEIWSDIACPFCYLGKRRFEEAVAETAVAVDVEYRSFELVPEAPAKSHVDQLVRKMGVSLDEARAMEERTVELARAGGLEIDYDRMRPARTQTAHRLLHYARTHGRQSEMLERLCLAYFSEGRDIGRVDELVSLAAAVGLDAEDVRRSLLAGEYLLDVKLDIQQAHDTGVRRLPHFVFDGRHALSGVQSAETLAAALRSARDDASVPG